MFVAPPDDTRLNDHSSSVPLHQQLCLVLQRQIDSGRFEPGDRFPTSRELCEMYGVSTTTVERALRRLAERGLIHRRPGRGTVVSTSPVKEELARLTGLSEAAEAQGVEFKNLVLKAEFFHPTERQAKILGLRLNEQAFRLNRLNTIRGGDPIGVELGIYSPDVGNLFLRNPESMAGALYQSFEVRFGFRLDRASQTIGAMAAGHREAELLGLPLGSPLVYFDRVTYVDSGRPIQFVRCCLPSARYSFHAWLSRHGDGPPDVLSFGNDQVAAVAADSWQE